MKVDNGRQAIHSFNLPENEHGHPAAGLCKKCWRSFTDRGAFDAHIRSKCETASRSKREKFQALIDTFCVIDQDRSSSLSDASGDEEGEDAECGVDDVPISATSSRSQSRSEDIVTRQEHQILVDRVAALEQMLIEGQMSQLTPGTMPSQQNTVAEAFTTSPAIPSQAFGYYSFAPGPAPSATTAAGRDPRTSIVGAMNARPLEGGATIPSFYNDADCIAATTGYRATVSRRTSPLTPADGGLAARQGGGNNPVGAGRAAADSAFAGAGVDEAGQQQQPVASHQGMEAFRGSAGVAGTVEDAGVSQQSSNTMMRTRWEHAVQVGDEMMMRGMDFFNGQGSSGDDLAKYLDMNSQ